MLRTLDELEGCTVRATDGDVGLVKDLYFDDKAWVVRYLVVETGTWLANRQVLISPISIGQSDWLDDIIPVTITRDQVKHSPNIDMHKPVSREHEADYLAYYGYPDYWGGMGAWGECAFPGGLASGSRSELDAFRAAREAANSNDEGVNRPRHDPHLRSADAVSNYHIHASDGDIGHVEGLLVDVHTWALRYLIVNTSNWWMGHLVAVPVKVIEQMNWLDATVSLALTREAVKAAPPYDAKARLDRRQEISIHNHFGRAGYWDDPPANKREDS
ncbi:MULTISPECIES: PRC-barrel domain-containing protein [Pandoraea]|uniref:Photosystem reaction center subunit H n=2 Tax=Pandoraea TaxID=93217 RepID=A0A5E4Y8A3_9BURK|nr:MULTISPECIES: PRC-barrel domain-containing protein [Pandoraea]VVD61779.1 photosystem reaction center subunit H [Pandoraea soli]VVE44864.1 photosystem reaction center subunit H [Pandoraea cepalis]